jgi:hypothetical protein
MTRLSAWLCLVSIAVLCGARPAPAQRGQPAPPAGRAGAPIDLTGTWVSLVTNEWRWRMLTPEKGDYAVLPINDAARRIADAWDPAKDEAAGEQCKGYGAAAIMQAPARLRVAWENDTTLRMDIDTGTQSRLFRFGQQPVTGEPSWQGHSAAEWQVARALGREGPPQTPAVRTGTLKVVTTRMRPGYLRRNGVPYSANAVVTEYFTRLSDRGADYLNVTVIVEDREFLTQPYVRSMQFRREPDGSKWSPTPCSAR